MILAHRWQVFLLKVVVVVGFTFFLSGFVYSALVRLPSSAYGYQPFGVVPSVPYPQSGGLYAPLGGTRIGLATRNSYLRPKPARFSPKVDPRTYDSSFEEDAPEGDFDEEEEDLAEGLGASSRFDSRPSDGSRDPLFDQKNRNELGILEESLDEIFDNDLVQFDHLHNLMAQFELYDVPTQIRLFLLVQNFIVRFQTVKAPGLGVSFNNAVSVLKNRLIECALNQRWPTAEKQLTTSKKPSVLGIQQAHLFEAFISDRSACHGLFNLWKVYTNPREMNGHFFQEVANFFSDITLPGKSYCVAASMFINRILDDLAKLIAAVEQDPDSTENGTHSLDDLNGFVADLSPLKDHFNDLVPAGEFTVLSATEINDRLRKITNKLADIESKSSEFFAPKDRKYLLSSRLSVFSDLQILLLRGGFGFLSAGDGQSLSKVIERILSLHCNESGPNRSNASEPSYGTFFLATVDFLYFLDCVMGLAADSSKIIPKKVQGVADKLKDQYSKWYAVLSVEPPLDTAYVFGKRTAPSIDMYSQLPEVYKDSADRFKKVDFLLACFPLVCDGMGPDAGRGLRVYRSLAFGRVNSMPDWAVLPNLFDPKQFKIEVDGASKKPQDVTLPEKVFNVSGITVDEMLKYSRELTLHAIRWMGNVKSKGLQKISDALTENNTFYTENVVSIALAWCKTIAFLDEASFLNGKKLDEFGVPVKWNSIVDLCNSFGEKGTTGRAISQMLRTLAQTHPYDALSQDLQGNIKDLFDKVSERTKSDPSFSSNLRLADALDLLGRIRTALNQEENSGYRVQGIATMAALFDPKRSIVADDLFPLAEAGNKQLIVSVMLKSGVEYSELEELVQSVPKKWSVSVKKDSLKKLDIQTLKAWDGFLTMFFSKDSQKSSFYLKFAKNKFDTGVKDLMARHKNITAELALRGDISPADIIPPFSFELRKTTKISPETLQENIVRVFRERFLKKSMVDLEACLMSLSHEGSSVFLYDEGFFGKNTYSLGKFEKSDVRSALLVLRGMLMVLDTEQFKQSSVVSFSLAAHMLVPLNYIAKEYGDKMNDARASVEIRFLTEMFYATYDLLKFPMIPDPACIPSQTSAVWNSCIAKPKDLKELLTRFDGTYPLFIQSLKGKATSSIVLSPSSHQIAVAINEYMPSAMLA